MSVHFTPILSNVFRATVVATWLLWLGAQSYAQIPNDSLAIEDTFQATMLPLLETHCFDCHGFGASEGGVSLDSQFASRESLSSRDKWLPVWKNLRWQLMPPADAEVPSTQDRQAMIRWIETHVFGLDPANPDPGQVVIRRMNREEYRNTIRDLLDIDYDTDENFPPDDTGYGFDTIGDVLTVSPLLLERYLSAAQTIVAKIREKGPDSSSYRRVFFDDAHRESATDTNEYRRKILRRFATRAYRRPIDETTLTRLDGLAQEMEREELVDFNGSVWQAVTAVLTSPRFLYRAEGSRSVSSLDATPQFLDEYELASRLSYFLWSSMPDARLMELAEKGKLRSNLRSEVDRMLEDNRSKRLISNFVGQWLRMRDVRTKFVSEWAFLSKTKTDLEASDFGYGTRDAMQRETEAFASHILLEDRCLDELLDADYSFLNERLAKVYGIANVNGRKLRKVPLPEDSRRGGLLTQASVLLITSNPQRTSPVNRGLFILENILGTPPPPAPPNVPDLAETKESHSELTTMRELLAQHRADPLCSSCHSRMDPLGLALESYDGLGLYRAEIDGKPVDTAGRLITGERFENAQELAKIIVDRRKHDFYRCVTEKLFTYAMGRGVEYFDAPSIDRIVASLLSNGGRSRSLIYGIVECDAFQKSRGKVTEAEK